MLMLQHPHPQAGLLSVETRGKEASHARLCDEWAYGGECERNGPFMRKACAASCFAAHVRAVLDAPAREAEVNGWLVLTDSAAASAALRRLEWWRVAGDT